MKYIKSSLALVLLAITGTHTIDNQDLRPDALGVNGRLGNQGFGWELENNDNPVFTDDEGDSVLVNELPITLKNGISDKTVTEENFRNNYIPDPIKPDHIGQNIEFNKELEAEAVNIAQQAIPNVQAPYIPDEKIPQVQAPEEPEDMPEVVQPYVPEPATPVHKMWESDPVMPDHNEVIVPPLTAEEQFRGWNKSYDLVATHDYTKFQNAYDLFAPADSRVPTYFPGFPLDTPVSADRLPVQSNSMINDLDGVYLEGEAQPVSMEIPENAVFVPLTPEDLEKYPELMALLNKPQPMAKAPGKLVRIIPYNGEYQKDALVKLSDVVDLGDVSNSSEGLPEYVHIVDGPFTNESVDKGIRFVKPSNYQKNKLLDISRRRQVPDSSLAVGSHA